MTRDNPMPAFRSLFRGSARLGVLLGSLELPWEKVTPFVEAFPEEMGRYQEISVSDRGVDLGLMTRGSGQDFTFRVTRYMEDHGVAEAALRRLLVTARFFEHRNLFFKVEIGADGPVEFSWYVRRRPELDVARQWLAAAGVGDDALDRMERVAAELGKRTVHFLACAEGADGTTKHKIYLSQPDAAASLRRIQRGAGLLGVDDASWAPLGSREEVLAGHTAFLSMGFADGALLPGAKIDVHDLDPEVVTGIVQEAAHDPDAAERIALLLGVMGRPRVDYAGFRLVPGQPVHTRVYAYVDDVDD
jgi:hypothetical protein